MGPTHTIFFTYAYASVSACYVNQRCHGLHWFAFQTIVSEIRTWRLRCDGRSRSARRSTRWPLRRPFKSTPTFSVCRSTSSCGGSDSPESCASLRQTTSHSFVLSADRISRILRSWTTATGLSDSSTTNLPKHWCAVTQPRCAIWMSIGYSMLVRKPESALSKKTRPILVQQKMIVPDSCAECSSSVNFKLATSEPSDVRLPGASSFRLSWFLANRPFGRFRRIADGEGSLHQEVFQLATANRHGIQLLSAAGRLGARRVVLLSGSLAVHYSFCGQIDEVKEICRRASRLSVLSLSIFRLRINCDCLFSYNGFEKSTGMDSTFDIFPHTVLLLIFPFPVRHMGWFALDFVTVSTRLLSLFLFECNAISRWYLGNFFVTCFSDQCVQGMHGVIAIVGGRLRRLKIAFRSTKICRRIMPALCGAVALERLEFNFCDDVSKLSANQLNEWIVVRRSSGDRSRWATRCWAVSILLTWTNPKKGLCSHIRHEKVLKIRQIGRCFTPRRATITQVVIHPFHWNAKKFRVFQNFQGESDGHLATFRWVQVQG